MFSFLWAACLYKPDIFLDGYSNIHTFKIPPWKGHCQTSWRWWQFTGIKVMPYTLALAVIHVWIQKLRPGHLWGNDCFWNVIMLLSFMSKMIGTVENPFLSIRLNLIWFSLQIPLNEKRASLFCTVSLTGFVHKTFFHGYKERNEVWKKKKIIPKWHLYQTNSSQTAFIQENELSFLIPPQRLNFIFCVHWRDLDLNTSSIDVMFC